MSVDPERRGVINPPPSFTLPRSFPRPSSTKFQFNIFLRGSSGAGFLSRQTKMAFFVNCFSPPSEEGLEVSPSDLISSLSRYVPAQDSKAKILVDLNLTAFFFLASPHS